MKAIILAGGFATRLWPLTERVAKPLLHVAGKPIISYIIEKLPKDMPIVIATNTAFIAPFKQWKMQKENKQHNITLFTEDSFTEEKKKGALGAIALVLKMFGEDDDILVLTGDNLFFFSFQKFLSHANDEALLAAFDVQEYDEAKKFGVIVPGKENTIQEFQEKPEFPKSTLVSTGCLYFPKRLLPELVKYSQKHNDNLGGVFEHFLNKKEKVKYFRFQEKWFDIGSFWTLLEAQKFLLRMPKLHPNTKVVGKNSFSKSVYISHGCHIENALLENVLIEEGATIRNASIRNSIIGKNSTVLGVDISGVSLREESFVTKE
jgi:glucose-1-phosphate thymidylyltransferase